jgi:hypothetical protein
MISLIYIFWMYVVLFAIIGGLRGWAKELLVAFAAILALAVNYVLHKYIPVIKTLPEESDALFWVRVFIIVALVYFGYQTVVSVAHLAAKGRSEKLQDSLFGIFLGAINGYLIAGSVFFYLHATGYQYFKEIITPPGGDLFKTIEAMMNYMPPHLLGEPGIYFAIIIAFIFVLVVYV